jgi:hypothetical protein
MNDPKLNAARSKCPMHLLPPIALREASWAHGQGAERYGPYNWRESGVKCSTYYGAILRHLTAWADGEDSDRDSGRSHLAHIIASCNILLDAEYCGKLEDDRPAGTTISQRHTTVGEREAGLDHQPHNPAKEPPPPHSAAGAGPERELVTSAARHHGR